MDPELLPGSGSGTRKIQSWIRIRNKSFRIRNTDFKLCLNEGSAGEPGTALQPLHQPQRGQQWRGRGQAAQHQRLRLRGPAPTTLPQS